MTKRTTLMLAMACALLALSASSAFATGSSKPPHGKKYTICGTFSYEGEPQQSCFPEELFQRTKTFEVEAGSYGNHSGTYTRQGRNYTFTAGQGECVLHGVKRMGSISGTYSCESGRRNVYRYFHNDAGKLADRPAFRAWVDGALPTS